MQQPGQGPQEPVVRELPEDDRTPLNLLKKAEERYAVMPDGAATHVEELACVAPYNVACGSNAWIRQVVQRSLSA